MTKFRSRTKNFKRTALSFPHRDHRDNNHIILGTDPQHHTKIQQLLPRIHPKTPKNNSFRQHKHTRQRDGDSSQSNCDCGRLQRER